MNYFKVVVPIFLVALALLTGFYFFRTKQPNWVEQNQDQVRTIDQGLKTEDSDIAQTDNAKEELDIVQIDDSKVASGAFVAVQSGKIIYKKGTASYALGLPEGQVAIMCTTQTLESVTALDFNKVVKVKVTQNDELSSVLAEDQLMVLLSEFNESGALIVHTIAVEPTTCD